MLTLPGLLPQAAFHQKTKGDFPFPWAYRPLKCFRFQELGEREEAPVVSN